MRRLLALLPLLAAPSTADAATFRGETTQGRPAAVRTGDDGMVKSVSVRWRAECDTGFLRDRTVIRAPFDKDSRNVVEHVDIDVARDADDPYRIRTKSTLAAQRDSKRRWSGTFYAKATVRDGERVISRCVLPEISFELKR